ncbi:AP-4 complex subunit mu isoform X1 [Zea mays]|uniref:AP-4 complex subunit mu isoform X1 n=1 Tax=Zea mays TaxID=4577 RepID=UPI00165311BA|nr:AP-4 complex subunit mu isoform X1 [Zea mays]
MNCLMKSLIFENPQTTSTEVLKSYIFNEPIMVDAGRLPPLGPAAMFMGYILTSEIDGTIQMKSYLTDNPEIRFALNEDLSIGRTGSSYSMSLDFPLTTSLGKL